MGIRLLRLLCCGGGCYRIPSSSNSARCRIRISTTISDTLGLVLFPSPSWPLIRRMFLRFAAARRAYCLRPSSLWALSRLANWTGKTGARLILVDPASTDPPRPTRWTDRCGRKHCRNATTPCLTGGSSGAIRPRLGCYGTPPFCRDSSGAAHLDFTGRVRTV
jgi:hypothetical protein